MKSDEERALSLTTESAATQERPANPPVEPKGSTKQDIPQGVTVRGVPAPAATHHYDPSVFPCPVCDSTGEWNTVVSPNWRILQLGARGYQLTVDGFKSVYCDSEEDAKEIARTQRMIPIKDEVPYWHAATVPIAPAQSSTATPRCKERDCPDHGKLLSEVDCYCQNTGHGEPAPGATDTPLTDVFLISSDGELDLPDEEEVLAFCRGLERRRNDLQRQVEAAQINGKPMNAVLEENGTITGLTSQGLYGGNINAGWDHIREAQARAESAEADARELWAQLELRERSWRTAFDPSDATVEKHRAKYGSTKT